MITMLLLLVIYLTFICPGLASSLFGTAFPAIQTEFDLLPASANYITILTTGFTILSSMFGARLVNKFSTRTVVAVCTTLAAVSFLGFSISPNLWVMCLFAIPLGLSAGATDAALNNYISLHYKAIHMNFMHCFFGIGTIASPYIMSIMLRLDGWRGGYRMVFLLQLTIAVIFILSFPLWKKVNHQVQNEDTDSIKPENLSYVAMAKNSAIRLDWLMCIAANAIEGVVMTWGSSFLIDAHSLSDASAAGLITTFFIGMTIGRFLSGLISTKISAWNLIKISSFVMLVGTMLMFVPVSSVAISGLFLVGLGVGPIYPNIMHLTPTHFGQKHSASVLSSQMAAAYLGILIAPPIFAWIANFIGYSFLHCYLLVIDIIFMVSAYLFSKKVKTH